MANLPACRLSLVAALLAAYSAGAHTSVAQAENMRNPVREHVNFTYQKITRSMETAKSSSVWIRNGQPHGSPPPGDALADLPRPAHGRIPPHTPEFTNPRLASPSGPARPAAGLDGVPGGWIWHAEGSAVRPRVPIEAKRIRRK